MRKKIFLSLTVCLFLLLTFIAKPAKAIDASAGQLVKTDESAFVMILMDGKRHAVPLYGSANLNQSETQYGNAIMASYGWSSAQALKITDAELNSYFVGDNVTLKPNSPYLIKIFSDAQLYRVDHDNHIAAVNASDYPSYSILTIPDVYFTSYTSYPIAPIYSLAINPSGTEGIIFSSPAGINCSIINGNTSGSCGANFSVGTVVTLTASSGGGNIFTGWSTSTNDESGCTGISPTCTLTMNRNHELGSVFSAIIAGSIHSLGLNPRGTNGTITSSPAGINCTYNNSFPGITSGSTSGSCNANFLAGTVVTLTVLPASGNFFNSWNSDYSGVCTGSSPACTLTMNQNYSFGPEFTSQVVKPDLKISSSLLGTVMDNPSLKDFAVYFNRLDAASFKPFKIKLYDKNSGFTDYKTVINNAQGNVDFSLKPGNYNLIITIDSDNTIDESDESNNILEKTVTVDAPTQTSTISNVRVTNITSNSAVVNWSTVEPDISYLQYGLVNSDNGINTEARNNNIVTAHVVLLNNLQSGKTYYYRISADSHSDIAQNATTFNYRSSVYNFTTTVSSDTQISQITTNANLLINDKMSEILAELNQLRSIINEQQTQIKYLSSLLKDVQGISADSQAVLNNFITYGVDANTVKLGAGERAAVINSYKAAFDKLPTTEAELADVIKIANGRWPSITNKDAENQAKAQFLKIYKRVADMNGANDNAAVTIMAYGLRQKAENRNLNSEVNGIKIFKAIYGHTPKTTEEWNAMQAITYSGATQKTWSGYNPNGN